MFYSQFILAKKGPLGTIWIAAHLERKLHKNQVADTDIGVSVDSILFPDVPIALRLSSHLLLGVVRIYNRKVNYLFDDCSEALLKVKQAFRSTAVDLPPEESKAPYHSITLPEKFDLDDFELPDSDIFQGNYVDHHISSREQITLQDSMEGVSYSTSKFGLDERFGDGDASGLDLDEELFLNKIGTAGNADESVDPHASYRSMTPDKQDEHPEDRAIDSEVMANGADEPADLMDFAQAPRTPGLVDEPTLSNAKGALACDDHLESEYHLMEFTVRENGNSLSYEDKQEINWCSRDDTNSDAVPQGQHEGNVHIPSDLEIKESDPLGESPIKGQDEAIRSTLEFSDRIEASDVPPQDDSPTKEVKEHKTIDETSEHHQGPNQVGLEKSAAETSVLASTTQQVSEGVSAKDHEIDLEKSAAETSGLASTTQQVDEGVSAKDLESPGVEVPNCVGDTSNQQRSCDDGPELALENQVGLFPETPETQPCQETTNFWNLKAHDKEVASIILVENPNVIKPGDSISTDVNGKSDTALLETYGREETMDPGKEYCITMNSERSLKENQVQEHASGEDIQVAIGEADAQVHNTNSRADAQVNNANSQDNLVENLNNSTEPELPAPEKLLAVPVGHMYSHRDMLVDISPSELGGIDAGSKSMAGKKRSFTESTLTEQSLNSVESSRHVRVKRTTGSVPDDDDLLSSILGGRKFSVLKLKPTPPLTEVTSTKRTRAVPRSGVPKRKLLMDDTMVLHGDMIRHQLTNTEDIRRVRKKAPCTFAEISMIQKRHMEDQIFLGTILTGVSVELASLHSQTYDLSHISVCKDDVNVASIETETEARLPSQDDRNDASLETVFEPYDLSRISVCKDDVNVASIETVTEARLPSQDDNNDHDASLETVFEQNLASLDEKYDASLETAAGSHLTSPNNENHDNGPGNNNVIEISEQVVNNELLIVRANEIMDSGENPLLSENRLEEVNYASTDGNISEEQTKPSNDVGPSDSQHELFVNVSEVETGLINACSENPSVIPEVEPLDPTGGATGNMGMVQTYSLNEFDERNSYTNMDASDAIPDQKTSMLSVELDYADIDGGQSIARNEVTEKDDDANREGEIEFGEKDDIFRGGDQDVAVGMVLDVNDKELEHNLETENYNIKSEKQQEVDFAHEAVVSVLEDGLMNNGENPNNSEAYEPNTMDADISGFDMRDGDDINYLAAGNDTEFLNVDDDDLTEIADDHMADDEETRYTENSGWSSRTRAVSKYLQTAFTKEAECGKKFLSTNNLLAGKSRKEASRMFFETLVLKTRDYIHVEQHNPYDDIIIKPRTRLMKSDF